MISSPGTATPLAISSTSSISTLTRPGDQSRSIRQRRARLLTQQARTHESIPPIPCSQAAPFNRVTPFGETRPRPLTPLENLDQDDGSGACQDIAEDSYYTAYPQGTHDYHDVLFAHAKVYALAQYLHVDSLVSMAYQRLSIILGGLQPITPFPHTARSVVELLRYVYAHTEETGDRMRKLVSQFTALNYPAVEGTAEMEGLLRGGGQLVVDLMQKVCRRMVASEEQLNKSREIAAINVTAGEELRAARAKVTVLEDRNDILLKARQGVRMVSVRVAILVMEMCDSKLAGVSTFGDRLDLLLDELQKLL